MYFAEIDNNGLVKRVIVADQAFIDSGAVGDPTTWKPTKPDASISKNYAGPGFTYDSSSSAFIPPKTYGSWTLDTNTAKWVAPKSQPTDAKYIWDEGLNDWVKVTI